MFTHIFNNKIGNLLLYMANNTKSLSVTKALKLLYIIDETSMREVGVPVTWSGYKVWKYGPVSQDVYDALNTPDFCTFDFNSFIKVNKKVDKEGHSSQFIKATTKFDDSEFTDYELELIDRIINKYGSKNAEDLVDILHTGGSLWSKQVDENQLDFELQGGRSDVIVPLTDLLNDSSEKQEIYSAAYESLMFQVSQHRK